MKIKSLLSSATLIGFMCLSSITNAQSTDLAEAHRQLDAGNTAQAQSLFENAGYSGNEDAQLILGNFYYDGMGGKIDKTKAAYWYEMAGQNGNISAMLLYGNMLENGDGIDRSLEMARHWYDKAAKAGNAQGKTLRTKIDDKILLAQGNTKADGFYENTAKPKPTIEPGFSLYKGKTTANAALSFEAAQKLYKDCEYEKALQALLALEQAGDIRAYNTLGDMHRLGQHVEKSAYIAVGYYLKGAKKRGDQLGDPLAQLNLGLMYEQGLGTAQSYEKAAEYYQLAVEGDNNRARAYLGELYETGKGVKQNMRSARFLYGVAARAGDSYAQKQLNRLDAASPQIIRVPNTVVKPVPKIDVGPPYQPQSYTARSENLANLADERLVKAFHDKKYTQVRDEIKMFAQQGMARHQVLMGKTYFQEKNYAEAIKWYKRAAAAENRGTAWIYIQEAQYFVGAMYNLGFGVPYDSNIAAGWFTLAIDYTLPNKQAAYELGRMYEVGKHIPQNDDKALEMYTKAGKKDADALFRSGYLYEKNYKQNYIYKRFAMEKYQQAADLSHSDGQFALGMAYYNGEITTKNISLAKSWLRKAAAQDNPNAIATLKDLGE